VVGESQRVRDVRLQRSSTLFLNLKGGSDVRGCRGKLSMIISHIADRPYYSSANGLVD